MIRKPRPRRSALTFLSVIGLLGCASDAPGPKPEADEALSGGATTAFDVSGDAFSRSAENISDPNKTAFFAGNAFFKRNWVSAPASTDGFDGLGPTFNARSCSTCHFKDGRGAPPRADEAFSGLLLRLSVPGDTAHGEPAPEPSYGGQFNHQAVPGVEPEGTAVIETSEIEGRYDDGTRYTLEKPSYVFSQLNFGALAENVMVSPRVAPAVFGLGLLEAIPEATIEDLSDPDDDDADGISGRANRVWDPLSQSVQLGRFGWKANQAGIEQQNSGALLGDIGISSPLFPTQDCPAPQRACQSAPDGGEPEVEQDKVDVLTAYMRLLAVPARRDVGGREVLRGKALFADSGCADCHITTLHTGELAGFPELANQTIHPYTDLLLHDMGDALADGRPDFLADGNEWRTPPLWGIGLVKSVNGHSRFLHDGRARDLREAILWHGGEAEAARAAFKALSASERDALIAFLDSL